MYLYRYLNYFSLHFRAKVQQNSNETTLLFKNSLLKTPYDNKIEMYTKIHAIIPIKDVAIMSPLVVLDTISISIRNVNIKHTKANVGSK